MATITANAEVISVLGPMKEVTEINDGQGNPLGVFTPASVIEEQLYDRLEEMFDIDELRRLEAEEKGGYTIDQVMQHLKSLETPA